MSRIPGLCLLPGYCPSLPVPSIRDFLPKMPARCPDFGPCPATPPLSSPFYQTGAGAIAIGGGVGTSILEGLCAVIEPCGLVVLGGVAVGAIAYSVLTADDEDDDRDNNKKTKEGRGYEVCRLASQIADPHIAGLTMCAYTCEHPPMMTTIVSGACPGTQIRVHYE